MRLTVDYRRGVHVGPRPLHGGARFPRLVLCGRRGVMRLTVDRRLGFHVGPRPLHGGARFPRLVPCGRRGVMRLTVDGAGTSHLVMTGRPLTPRKLEGVRCLAADGQRTLVEPLMVA